MKKNNKFCDKCGGDLIVGNDYIKKHYGVGKNEKICSYELLALCMQKLEKKYKENNINK